MDTLEDARFRELVFSLGKVAAGLNDPKLRIRLIATMSKKPESEFMTARIKQANEQLTLIIDAVDMEED